MPALPDRMHMAHALRLSRRGLGQVWPNPAVGCVIVKDGRVIGRGWTQTGGRPHAEAMALQQAGAAAKGATAYVTLEPCSHVGRAPPCAEALVSAGVARVVSAMTDPDPRVSGRGHQLLRDAGIEVIEDCLGPKAADINAGFVKRVTIGKPVVTLKLANSFDGRIATASGESQWITAPEARRHVHFLRMTHDAVMVGGGTARADQPALNVRGFGVVRQPLRVIVSRNAQEGAFDLAGVKRNATGICLEDLLTQLADYGITRVFCEGGGQLAASLLREDLVDQLVGYTAGLAIGGDGIPSLAGMGLTRLADAPRFRLDEMRKIGPDIMHSWSRR